MVALLGLVISLVATAEPEWAVSPHDGAPDLPVSGRSTFDRLVAEPSALNGYRLPFPLPRLLDHLRDRAGYGAELRTVLIPMGRSLQRNAANPQFFRFPRVVSAFVSDGRPSSNDAGFRVADRVFIGYQEKAGVVEVISYNDGDGRFEFQVIDDYVEGGKPQLSYVPRGSCTACHQNQGPIFSRPLWSETNANDDVARRLAMERASFYGVPARVGVDVPDAIDRASDRGAMIPVWQRMWRDGCGGESAAGTRRCRSRLLNAALRYRLDGHRWSGAVVTQLAESLTPIWRQRWPHGLAIPSADIPNRTLKLFQSITTLLGLPTSTNASRPVDDAALQALTDIPDRFEPFTPRSAQSIWRAPKRDHVATYVAGLADLFSDADVARLSDVVRSKPDRLESIIDQMAHSTQASALSGPTLSRRQVMLALSVALSLPPQSWDDEAAIPAAALSGPR